MAKRARGSVRPGQRRPIDRRPTTAPASGSAAPAEPRASGLTASEEARAAEIEQQLLAQERQAEAARVRARERSAARESYSGGGGGSLSVRAQEEYAYVARDVRQIGIMAVLMLAILFGLWFLIDIAKVFPIN